MMKSILSLTAAAALLAACGGQDDTTDMDNTEGPVGSASAGYSDVGPLTQNEQGVWTGTAQRDGAPAQVSVDYRGAVTPAAN